MLTKSKSTNLIKTASGNVPSKASAHGTLAKNAAPQALKLKEVLIVDTGDGAFTDDSVKVKPHHDNPALMVFKCTDLGRLMTALAASGIKPIRVKKGNKHFIAFVNKADVGNALSGQRAPATLPGGVVKTLNAPKKLLK